MGLVWMRMVLGFWGFVGVGGWGGREGVVGWGILGEVSTCVGG